MKRDDLSNACAALEDAPAERYGEGWSGSVFGFCPVQGEGTVDGWNWYFRSRHDVWRFEVFAPHDREAVIYILRDADVYGVWMPISVAWRIIEESIAKWRARELP